jgi:hypothetical protein
MAFLAAFLSLFPITLLKLRRPQPSAIAFRHTSFLQMLNCGLRIR